MARKFHQGVYTPINRKKYLGDVSNIIYRSGWELQTFKFCDLEDKIEYWNSEEVIIPYYCRTDNDSNRRIHHYHVDLFIQWKTGRKILVEVKPMKDALPAKVGKGRRNTTVLNEQLVYLKNMSKWEAARAWAADRGMVFMVWTEVTLKSMGILV